MYLNSPDMVAGMRRHLFAAGLDLKKELERGALVLSSDQGHLNRGRFDIARMLQLLEGAANGAVSDGFAGLWASGDMTWEFAGESNLDKLSEYELRLEEVMWRHPHLSGICLYRRDTLPAHAIETALVSHSSLYLSASLSEVNPRYYVTLAQNG